MSLRNEAVTFLVSFLVIQKGSTSLFLVIAVFAPVNTPAREIMKSWTQGDKIILEMSASGR